ncbi:unnamed protein product, partial [Polarella glacialis]
DAGIACGPPAEMTLQERRNFIQQSTADRAAASEEVFSELHSALGGIFSYTSKNPTLQKQKPASEVVFSSPASLGSARMPSTSGSGAQDCDGEDGGAGKKKKGMNKIGKSPEAEAVAASMVYQ